MGGRTTTRRRQKAGIGSLMLPFVTFVLGYLVANAFNMSQLSGWMATNVLNHSSATSVKAAPLQAAELPKPKFEFYTLLTKEHSKIPEAAVIATPTPAPKSVVQSVAVANSAPSVTTAKTDAAPIDLTVTQKLPLHEPFVATASAQPKAAPYTAPTVTSGGRYIIQVGSFRNSREAEKMKATLAMRGFSAVITSSTQQQITWYRVLIGPFGTLSDAQKVHHDFAQRERITGMIRKLDA